MFSQTFTRGTQSADLADLESRVAAVVGPATVSQVLEAGATSIVVVVAKAIDWTASDVTSVQQAVNAAANSSPALVSQRAIDQMPISMKAVLLALVDQLNVIRAALPTPLAAITPAQAIAAVRAKAGTL